MKAFLRFLAGLALFAVALAVIGAVVVYSGAYNVSATSGHTKLVGAVLNKMTVQSVRAHARDIVSPVSMDFRSPEILEHGAGHFEAMCRTCHGAPGKKADPWQLYPPAPDLADAVRDHQWSDAEVFWIIKNGIKDSAMSAFGGSHSDEDIWGMVAFIRQLPSMAPDRYSTMAAHAREHMQEENSEQHAAEHEKQRSGDAPRSEPPHQH
jgi:hypothetical protein